MPIQRNTFVGIQMDDADSRLAFIRGEVARLPGGKHRQYEKQQDDVHDFSMNRDWGHGGSRRAFQFEWLQDECEFVDAFGREFIQLEALEHMDAVYGQQNLVYR